jgi:hypothetical protein
MGRDVELADELTIWAFHMSSNPYVPYGTRNPSRYQASTTKEYWRLEVGRGVRRTELLEDARAAATERRAARAERHVARMRDHVDAVRRRLDLIAEMRALPPPERMRFLIQHSEHPPGYFPNEFVDVEGSLKLPAPVQAGLIEWLAWAPRGPWRLMRRTLISLHDKRSSPS